jgi:hypothetical protein
VKSESATCPVCDCLLLGPRSHSFFRHCVSCGLQVSSPAPTTGVVTNQAPLTVIKSLSLLQREQLRIAKLTESRDHLIDFGSGVGSFLDACKKFGQWSHVIGVEPDIQSRQAALSLGLDVFDSLLSTPMPSKSQKTVITLWHSLEHLPMSAIDELIDFCFQTTSFELLIAVPNGECFLWQKFGSSWPYFDPERHYYQFTEGALDAFAKKYELRIVARYTSVFYELFALVQTMLNLSSRRPRNFFYNNIKRKGLRPRPHDLLWAVVVILFRLPLLLISAYSLLRKRNRSVLIFRMAPQVPE